MSAIVDISLTVTFVLLFVLWMVVGLEWVPLETITKHVWPMFRLWVWDFYRMSPLTLFVDWVEPIPERIITKEVIKEIVKFQNIGQPRLELYKESPITIVMGEHQLQCYAVLRNARFDLELPEWEGALRRHSMNLELDIVDYRQANFEPVI